jgi:Putative beta-barrel porin-2, OmpL-like. bbp2
MITTLSNDNKKDNSNILREIKMKSIPKRKLPLIIAAGSLLSMTIGTTPVIAAPGAVAALSGFDVNETALLKDNNITVGGWANAGITYNPNNPSNGINGPVTFGDLSGTPQLNQLNMFIQRAVATEGTEWSFGGRFDAMFGTDSIFTQAYGVPYADVNTGLAKNRGNWDLSLLNMNTYGIALPQAYLETYAPIGNGLDVKIGHFYTPIGYETVPANENFFYTHAYTMQYGEPFTHTGALGNYAVNSNWSAMGGITTGSATGGWDGSFNQQLGNWSGIAGTTWTSDDKGTSANIAATYGATSEQSNNPWALYSIVVKHNITDKTHLVLQHDHGYANGVIGANGRTQNAEWYGINSHLTYDLKDNLTVGMRAEWFDDANGFRVWSPGRVSAATYAINGNASNTASYAGSTYSSTSAAANYYQLTIGANWKPVTWLNLRPNIRYDHVSGSNANGIGSYSPFGGRQDQVLFSTDFYVNF